MASAVRGICMLTCSLIMTVAFSALCSRFTLAGGGLISGGLHAISGPDHLGLLLPCIVGRDWWHGAVIGTIWGLGHGLTSFVVGMVCYILRGHLIYMEGSYVICIKTLAVGVTLIVIGIMGIHETRDVPAEDSDCREVVSTPLASRSNIYLAYFINGLIMGLSWDGLPSLAPTLALPQIGSALVFLAFYCVGTSLFMGGVSALVARGAAMLGDAVNDHLPTALAFVASVFAIVSGLFCLLQGLVIAVAGDSVSSSALQLLRAAAGLGSVASTAALLHFYSTQSQAIATLLAPVIYFCVMSVSVLHPHPQSSKLTSPKGHVHVV